ncbi:MAG: hypothetical protein SFV22_10040, partial [Saprospiraceae bacterium]|nr:hypothetical protein [Saprospiraceae bacterium]
MGIRYGLFFLLLLAAPSLAAQQISLDSMMRLEKRYLKEDSVRAKLLNDIARRYYTVNPREGVRYAEQAIALGEKLSDKKFLAGAYSAMGSNRLSMADYPAALDNYQKALDINQR